jgi:SAM-dependent methyltransferase
MTNGRLTDEAYWDGYWEQSVRELPVVISRDTTTFQAQAILDVLDRWLEPSSDMTALEVGGSPGQYLAYLHRRTGYRCAVLDFSPVGCALTRKNFSLLEIPVTVYERDMFDHKLDIGQFDVVYSLGLIEHFADVAAAVAAHVRLVRAGGLLILGVPNFAGVNGWFAERIDRPRFTSHNLDAMRLDRWDRFETAHDLQRLFRGYVGGFEPGVFAVTDNPVPFSRLPLRLVAEVMVRTVGMHLQGLRRFNHPLISGYLMGVWRVTSA